MRCHLHAECKPGRRRRQTPPRPPLAQLPGLSPRAVACPLAGLPPVADRCRQVRSADGVSARAGDVLVFTLELIKVKGRHTESTKHELRAKEKAHIEL